MSKNKKKNKNLTAQVNKAQADAELEKQVVPTGAENPETQTENSTLTENSNKVENSKEDKVSEENKGKGKNKAVEVKAKDVDKKKKKEKVKKPNKVAKALKDTGSELKKVTWPKFGEVVKQTGIVLVVVIVFALVLLGLDKLCSLLVGLLN